MNDCRACDFFGCLEQPGDCKCVCHQPPPPLPNVQCPTCKFWTAPLPNGLVPEHGLPYGTGQLCPGQTVFRPRLVVKEVPDDGEGGTGAPQGS